MASKISSSNPYVNSGKTASSLRQPRMVVSSAKAMVPSMAAAATAIRPMTSMAIAPKLAAAASESKSSSLLAHVWREIQGSDDWEGLVEPLNPVLRQEIIRYGQFVNACYMAFDLDPSSKRYLNCKYGKKRMFSEVGMEGLGNYEVTKYIYATPDINIPMQNGTCCSRWIGYVAVSSDDEVRRLGRRDIVVTFRGTVTNTEWIANFMSALSPARLDPTNPRPDVKVESGFLSLYTSDDSTCKFSHGSCREQLLSEFSRLINKYKDEEMSITLAGHSMGSSLAILFAYDLAELGLNRDVGSNREKPKPITVYSFAGPRVGNLSFKERCEELGVKVLRVVNVNDPITKLPGVFLNENFRVLGGKYEHPWRSSCYAHVGVELALNFFKMQDLSCVHDLETYIRLLRCPERVQVEKDNEETDHLLSKVRRFFISQQLDAWPWRDAALSVCNLVQSLRI